MTVYQHIARNKRRTIGLMTLFIAILLAMGYFAGEYYDFGGYTGLFYMSVLAFIMTLVSYFAGDTVSLKTAGAIEINKEDNPYLWNMVENVSITAGLPMPRVYIIPDPSMNAFATGRDPQHASVAFTEGIIDALENEELEAVVAHELSHVKNYDTRLMMVIVVLVGLIALFSDWMFRVHFFGERREKREGGAQIELIFAVVGVALIILSPIISELIKLAVSRKREYLADASAVLLTRYADGLVSALRKIQSQDVSLRRANHATAHLYFTSPFRMKKIGARLFSTHPPIEERIAALEEMAGKTKMEYTAEEA